MLLLDQSKDLLIHHDHNDGTYEMLKKTKVNSYEYRYLNQWFLKALGISFIQMVE